MKEILIGKKNTGKTTFIKQRLSANIMEIYWSKGVAIVDFNKEYDYYKGHGKIDIIDYSNTPLPECATRMIGTLRRYRDSRIVVDGFGIVLLGLEHSLNNARQEKLKTLEQLNQTGYDIIAVDNPSMLDGVKLLEQLKNTNWLLTFQSAESVPYEIMELTEKIYLCEGTATKLIAAQHYSKITKLPKQQTQTTA